MTKLVQLCLCVAIACTCSGSVCVGGGGGGCNMVTGLFCNETKQIKILCISQHSNTCRSERKLVSKEVGMGLESSI